MVPYNLISFLSRPSIYVTVSRLFCNVMCIFLLMPVCLQVWAGPLSNNRMVLILLNRRESRASITAKWEDIGLESSHEVQIRNLWKVYFTG